MSDPALSTVAVDLGERSYDIVIGPSLLASSGERLRPHLPRPRLVVVTDANVARLHLKTLAASLDAVGIGHEAIVMPAGEKSKSYAHLAALCDKLLAAGVERDDVVFAFGGGVIGDLVGFAAAILRRGVAFIQCPTTLLAQVDSSVGGKTGINSPLGKNLIGAFHQPRLVLADTRLLDTLPDRELKAGYAEVAKYGLLGDRELFEWLETAAAALLSGDDAARLRAVTASCRAKAEIVGRDETERGDRALLNLGHTFAHALEAATGYSDRLLHGEAVAIGMAMAFRFSSRLGLCPAADVERVERHLEGVGLPIRPKGMEGGLPPASEFLELMRQDKKSRAGRLVFILVRGIGAAFVARDVEASSVESFLRSELD